MTREGFVSLSALTEYTFDTRNSSVRDVLRLDTDSKHPLEHDGLDLSPPYQRGSVWTLEQRQNLIKSTLEGIPVGVIFINDRGDYVKRIVDGKQRLEAYIAWYAGELEVPMEWFNRNERIIKETHIDDPICTWDSLTEVGQRFFNNTASLATYWTRLKTVEQEEELYLRINYGGTPHEPLG